MTLRAVLFDCFDTLAYYPPSETRAEGIRLVAEAGVSEERWIAGWRSTWERALRGEIQTMEERVRESLAAAGLAQPPENLVRALTASREDQVRTITAYSDVQDCLLNLRQQGYRLGLIGNLFAYEASALDRLGARSLLDDAVLSCEMGIRKPDPRIYLAAAERLSVPPAECIFIGDGMSRELSGAKAVGMTAVRIDRDHRSDDDPRDEVFDFRVTNLQELLDWLPSSAG